MTKQTRFNVGYAIAAIFLVFMIQYAVSVANQIAPIPYSDFQRLLHEGKIATVGVSDRFIQGVPERAATRRAKAFRHDPRRPAIAGSSTNMASRSPATSRARSCATLVLGRADPAVLRALDGSWSGACAGQQGLGGGLMSVGKSKAKVYVETDTKVPSPTSPASTRPRRNCSEVVAFLKDPARLRPARRARAEGRAAGRPARHRQDAAGARRRGRGRRAVLLDQRLGIRRDVRRRRRGPRARPVRAGAPEGARDHLHRRARRARPRPRRLSRGRRP